MKFSKIELLLKELGSRTAEPVRSGLNEEIKQRIPHRLTRHKIGWDTVNIIIDLRLNRSVAAAVIIISVLFLLNLYGSRDGTGGIVQDSKLLIKYLGIGGKADIEAGRTKYELLIGKGEDVTWYGDWVDPADSNSVIMKQKLSDSMYMVTFVDGREEKVNTEQLVELLSRTIQKNSR